MKPYLILGILLFCSASLVAQDKKAYDLSGPLQRQNAHLASTTGGYLLQNRVLEATLFPGAFFTIGTAQGLSESELDDRCGITYGHPYALTSYPLLSVDGVWQKPDDFFSMARTTAAKQNGDTLTLALTRENLCRFEFSIFLGDDGRSLVLGAELVNIDTVAHDFGLGLVFDPALGRWGDGHVLLPAAPAPVSRDTLIGANVPAFIEIHERQLTAAGLKVKMDFSAGPPQKLIIANWHDIINDPSPEFQPNPLRKLYDLTLKMFWNTAQAAPGERQEYAVTLALLPPEFSGVFSRWDMPQFLSMQNNSLFPRDFTVTAQVANTGQTTIDNVQFRVDGSEQMPVRRGDQTLSLTAGGYDYPIAQFSSKEVFEDVVTEVGIVLESNGRILDRLMQNVLIPATPLSDTGLTISIDTLRLDRYPEVNAVFRAEISRTGQRIFGLRAENVFLFEAGARIREFSLAKDTTGGVKTADIVFVLDVTGSMGDEINQVKSNIIEFADSVALRGIDLQLGLVTFLDEIENVYPFTRDIQLFQQQISRQYAHGGGDGPENSLAALMRASEFAFRPQAKRIVIWITDAPYHEADGVTPLHRQEVINALLSQDITVHAIGTPAYQTDSYDAINIATGGNFYDINGNFRDILLEIARLQATDKFLLTYRSLLARDIRRTIKIEVHIAGLGGSAELEFTPGQGANVSAKLWCYPNPFNPQIKIRLHNPGHQTGALAIYNVLGQRVKSFPIRSSMQRAEFLWDARDARGLPVGAGYYFVRAELSDPAGKVTHRETAKILYLK